MDVLGTGLIGFGLIIALVCGLWTLVLQFQTSILWGLACLLLPLVGLLWLVLYWEDGKRPLFVSLIGCAFMLVGLFILPEFRANL